MSAFYIDAAKQVQGVSRPILLFTLPERWNLKFEDSRIEIVHDFKVGHFSRPISTSNSTFQG